MASRLASLLAGEPSPHHLARGWLGPKGWHHLAAVPSESIKSNQLMKGEYNVPNKKGWYSKDEVQATGLPCYVTALKRWTHEPYPFAVLLTKTRCRELGIPVLANGQERPSAFRSAAAETYYPLYDRTCVFASGELSTQLLNEYEIMGKLAAGN